MESVEDMVAPQEPGEELGEGVAPSVRNFWLGLSVADGAIWFGFASFMGIGTVGSLVIAGSAAVVTFAAGAFCVAAGRADRAEDR